MLDHRLVQDRFHLHGLLGQALEHRAPVTRAAAVQPERELVEAAVEIVIALGRHSAAASAALSPWAMSPIVDKWSAQVTKVCS